MTFRSRNYVIVGDGAAGVTAARTLRTLDGSASISLISDDPNPAYFRAALTNYLLGELREEQIWATPPSFYDQYRLTRLHCRVLGLDPARARIQTSQGGAPLHYDALLIASGARARTPSFAGQQLQGVLTLRTLQDCRGVMERIAAGKVRSSVVIGGGPLALEWALGMHARQVQVSVLLRGTTFMAGALDAVASDLLAARLRQAGVRVLLNDEVSVAVDRGDGSVCRVQTKRGETLECDLLAAAIGVVPNTEWLQLSDIKLSKSGAVIVNELMQTSLPNVYAAGDVIEFAGRGLQLWEPAQTQAGIAARNMSGLQDRYAPGVHYMATRLFDLDFASLGQVTVGSGASGGSGQNEMEELSELPRGTGSISYKKVLLKQGRLVGALMLGQREAKVRQKGRLYKRLIDAGTDVQTIRTRLLDDDFDLRAWIDERAPVQPSTALLNPAAANPTASTGPAAPPRSMTAAGAQVKGTALLRGTALVDVARLLAPQSPGGASRTSTPPPESARGRTALLSDVLLNLGAGAAKSTGAPDVKLAAGALGTQVLTQFNARPEVPPPAFTTPRPALLILGNQRIPLSSGVVRLGRDPSSHVLVNDPAVELIHAHIEGAAGQWYLRDLGSRFGTWINTELLSVPRRLVNGDRIRLGQADLVFWFAGEEGQVAARQPAQQAMAPPASQAHPVPPAPASQAPVSRSPRSRMQAFQAVQDPSAIGNARTEFAMPASKDLSKEKP